jgi:tetratricopeptide (TPR) repeat protein
MKTVAATIAFLAPAGIGALADIVHLKTGETLEGRITAESGNTVLIETADGVFEVDKEDIARIEKKPWTPPAKPKPSGKDPRKIPGFPDVQPAPKFPLVVFHRDPFYNFRIHFPEGWRVVSSEGGSFRYSGPAGDDAEAGIDLEIVASGAELGKFVSSQNEALSKRFADAKIESNEDRKVGPHPARRVLASYTDGGPARLLRRTVDAGGRKLTLSCDAPKAAFEKSLPFGSLRVFPEHPASEERRAEYAARHNAGVGALNSAEWEKALQEFEKLREMVPNFPELHFLIFNTCTQMKEWKKAADALRAAVKLDPDHFEYRFHLSRLLSSMNKLSEAEQEGLRAVELQPWSDVAWVNLGSVLLTKSSFRKAKEAYRRALEINPKSIPATYNLGVLYEAQSRFEDAQACYEQVLKLQPGHAEAQRALERVKSRK